MFVLSSTEDQCAHLELLFSKHTKYLLKICQQIIQSQRFKKVSITLKRVLKNMTEWFDSNPYINLTKHITDCQEHRNDDIDKERYTLINQGVTTTNNQYYITHQKSILSNTVTENDIYDNYSYTSSVNWEIEKTPETPSKKLESNIDKPETGPKKIDFDVITNNDRSMTQTTIKWFAIATTHQMVCTITLTTRMYNKNGLPITVFTPLAIPNYN